MVIVSPSQTTGLSATSGITLAYTTGTACGNLVQVSGGLFAKCYMDTGTASPGAQDELLSDRGVPTPLPNAVRINDPWFPDPSGDLVAVGTVASSDPLAANPTGPRQLLVIQPSSGSVRKAIPLPSDLSVNTFLAGVRGTTAVLTNGDRMLAYALDGKKLWDIPLPPGGGGEGLTILANEVLVPWDVSTTQGQTLGSVTNTTVHHMSALRLADGTAMWSVTMNAGFSSPPLVGRTVFYDDAGEAWSLMTGARSGPGLSKASPVDPQTGKTATIGSAAVYQDDIIVSDPLRRITPAGSQVWSIPGSSGLPASDGKLLLVAGRGTLVALDPATGRSLAQASPASPTQGSIECHGVLQIFSHLAAVSSNCGRVPTAVYRLGNL